MELLLELAAKTRDPSPKRNIPDPNSILKKSLKSDFFVGSSLINESYKNSSQLYSRNTFFASFVELKTIKYLTFLCIII